MTIHFIIGPPNSGKTTYREEHLNRLPAIDIIDFQEDLSPFWSTKNDILHSYAKHRRACIDQAARGGDFIIEHTLMKALRRRYYIRRLLQPGVQLVCHFTTNGGVGGSEALKVWEPPTLSEGFTELHPIPTKE